MSSSHEANDHSAVHHRLAPASAHPPHLLCCRACQLTPASAAAAPTQLLDLCAPHNRPLLRKLRTCVDTHIDITDGRLPRHLCAGCAASVEAAHRFRIRCEYIDQQWRDALLLSAAAAAIHGDSDKPQTADVVAEVLAQALPDEPTPEHLSPHAEPDEYIEEYIDFEDQSDGEPFDHYQPSDPIEVPSGPSDTAALLASNCAGEMDDHEAQTDEETLHLDEEYIDDIAPVTAPHEDLSVDKTASEPPANTSSPPSHRLVTTAAATTTAATAAARFRCDTCAAQLPTFAALNEHKKSHGKQRYQCPTCAKWFSKRYHLKNHETIHAPDAGAQYPCTACTKCYSNRGNLERHMRVYHQQQRAHVCAECGKRFSQSSILRQHLAVHTAARDWSCDLCPKRFKTREYLQLHRNRHVATAPPPAQRKATLPKKQRSATAATGAATGAPRTRARAKQSCQCQFCGKQSNSVALHVSHMRTHTGEKPYECELCHKRFSFQQSLKTHRLLHSGEKPYRCDECGQQFRQIGHLAGHRLTHSGRRQHACAYCPKAFALRGNLTVHMRMHTGETPYRCEWCGKKFNDSNGLKRHVVVHGREGGVAGMGGAGGGVRELKVKEEVGVEEEEEVDEFSYSDVIAYESEEEDGATTVADGEEHEEHEGFMLVAAEEGGRDGGEGDDAGQTQDGYAVVMVDMP